MITYITENSQLTDNLSKIGSLKRFSLDTETTGIDPYSSKILLFQIGDLDNQFIIDCRKVNIEPLRKIIENETIIGTNLKFDYKHIKHNYNIEIENPIDCFLIEKIIMSGKVHPRASGYFALDDMVKKYCGVEIDKEIRVSFSKMNINNDFTEEQLKYACDDIIWNLKVYDRQREIIDRLNIQNTVDLECRSLPAFGDIEYNGFYLDKEEWMNQYNNIIKENTEIEPLVRSLLVKGQSNLFGECSINLNSDSQLLKTIQKAGYKIPNTKEQTLLFLPEELHKPLIKFKKIQKALNSFGEAYLDYINNVTGRIHADINQIGAASGRSAFGKPNLQQIKKEPEYRSCFRAQNEGSKIITTDYSGQELRIIAEISREPKWVEILNDPSQDLHTYVASLLFNIPIDEVTKPVRTVGKNLDFGVAYGCKEHKVMMFYQQVGLECDIDKASNTLNKFFTLFPLVVGTLDNIAKRAAIEGRVDSLGGRPRFFDIESSRDLSLSVRDRNNIISKIEREGRNHSIQSSGADQLKLACALLRDRIKKHQLKLKQVHIVHDETVNESLEDHEHNQYHIERAMLMAQEYYQELIPAAVEGVISDVWSKA